MPFTPKDPKAKPSKGATSSTCWAVLSSHEEHLLGAALPQWKMATGQLHGVLERALLSPERWRWGAHLRIAWGKRRPQVPAAVGQPEALQASSCRCAHRRLQNTMKKRMQSYHATPGKIRLWLNGDFSSRFPIPSSSTSCFQEEGTCSPSEKRELLPGPAHVLLPLSTSVWNAF